MGIPSYFSYIIKNHSTIIQNYNQIKKTTAFSALFLDSNSIVYDVVHAMPVEEQTGDERVVFHTIIDKVIEKLNEYISLICPLSLTYIAFDGIAPFAKLEQQKTRRYKSAFLTAMTAATTLGFNTIMITPGTPFMNCLSQRIIAEFSQRPNVIVSASDECGEGEHKLCHYLREHPFPNENVVIYGLDADLIMLGLFHQKYAKNIYVCREKPNFAQGVLKDSFTNIESAKELLFLDIKELSHRIMVEMNCRDNAMERVFDYVFLCFFLGNDFLPQFPSLNIRTAGMDRLMDTYRQHIGKYDNRRFLSRDGEILWKWIHLFIKELAKNEREFLIQEYGVRDHWEKQTQRRLNTEKVPLDEWVNNTPILFREIEHYISPHHSYWENRYYESLLRENTLANIKSVSLNYLEGLEWVYIYYTRGCKNTRWKYNYNYPPLLIDLVNYIPLAEHSFVKKDHTIISQREQLEYIIPPVYWKDVGLQAVGTPTTQPLHFAWSFKRYFWEAHCKA
jgi:5'-3' exonuclease